MKNLKVYLTMLICSFVLLNTTLADSPKKSPETKLADEICMMLDHADRLDLDGQTIETTIVFKVNEDRRCELLDSGTEHPKLEKYIRSNLNEKRIWTRDVDHDMNYFVTVVFREDK